MPAILSDSIEAHHENDPVELLRIGSKTLGDLEPVDRGHARIQEYEPERISGDSRPRQLGETSGTRLGRDDLGSPFLERLRKDRANA
jgi:hypothetical protein